MIKASSIKDTQAKQIWSGFWSKAAIMVILKKIVFLSKARVDKKKNQEVVLPTGNDDIPIPLFFHTAQDFGG